MDRNYLDDRLESMGGPTDTRRLERARRFIAGGGEITKPNEGQAFKEISSGTLYVFMVKRRWLLYL